MNQLTKVGGTTRIARDLLVDRVPEGAERGGKPPVSFFVSILHKSARARRRADNRDSEPPEATMLRRVIPDVVDAARRTEGANSEETALELRRHLFVMLSRAFRRLDMPERALEEAKEAVGDLTSAAAGQIALNNLAECFADVGRWREAHSIFQHEYEHCRHSSTWFTPAQAVRVLQRAERSLSRIGAESSELREQIAFWQSASAVLEPQDGEVRAAGRESSVTDCPGESDNVDARIPRRLARMLQAGRWWWAPPAAAVSDSASAASLGTTATSSADMLGSNSFAMLSISPSSPSGSSDSGASQ